MASDDEDQRFSEVIMEWIGYQEPLTFLDPDEELLSEFQKFQDNYPEPNPEAG
jgi:hypothetical protein